MCTASIQCVDCFLLETPCCLFACFFLLSLLHFCAGSFTLRFRLCTTNRYMTMGGVEKKEDESLLFPEKDFTVEFYYLA